MFDPSAEKVAIRSRIREVLAGMSVQERHARSVAAENLLLASPEFAHARVIMIYMTMSQEVDTTAIALRAWQEGKQVVAPKLYWNDHIMLPVEIHSMTTAMREHPNRPREPLAGQPIPLEFIDLILVPGLAFGAKGYRIGRGSGFYDRFLCQEQFQGVSCGMGFEQQVIDELPVQRHDIPLDMVVTDVTVRRFQNEPANWYASSQLK